MIKCTRLTAILLLVTVASLGVAGCGGDDSSDTPPSVAATGSTGATSEITKAELISQGDDICAEVNAAVGTISASTTADETVQQDQISDIYSGLAQRLEELGIPSDGSAPDQVTEAAQALAKSVSSDRDSALADFQSAATEYGFSKCGDDPEAPSSSSGTGSGDESSTPTTPAPTAPAPTPTTPAPTAPAPAPPSTGGGVAPPPPSTGGGSGTGGGSSGGIGPG